MLVDFRDMKDDINSGPHFIGMLNLEQLTFQSSAFDHIL